MSTKEYKFRPNTDLGNLEAELDQFLLEGFVEKDDYSLVKDVSSSKTIILGRTGSGKSALLRKLSTDVENFKIINPEALSLQHLSNSNIINYFQGLGVKLDLFYKVLWRHVFIVEIIKMHFPSEQNRKNEFFRGLFDRFRKDRTKTKALQYLEKWEEKFFENTEYQIKEIETNLEMAFKASVDGNYTSATELYKFLLSLQADKKKNERTLIEVKKKAQSVVNAIQIDEVNELKRLIQDEILPKTQRRYYILIDDLDKDWVDTRIVYDLIRALVEVIKEFTRIPQVKIVIALRTNIDDIVFHENTTRGLQREKMKYLYLKLNWTISDFKSLINNRLKLLMKEVYTNRSPTVADILPDYTKSKGDAFKYMVERTLMRPRDILDFFNRCIEKSKGKTRITWSVINSVEKEYSEGRMQALDDEWLENVGDLDVLYSVIKKQSRKFTISSIHDHANSHFVQLISQGRLDNLNDRWRELFEVFGDKFEPIPLLKEIFALLHNVGILGIKRSPEEPIEFIQDSFSQLKPDEIEKNSPVFYVHPAFYKGLKIV